MDSVLLATDIAGIAGQALLIMSAIVVGVVTFFKVVL